MKAIILLSLLMAGCQFGRPQEESPPPGCIPGAVVECPADVDLPGRQTCLPDGTFGACEPHCSSDEACLDSLIARVISQMRAEGFTIGPMLWASPLARMEVLRRMDPHLAWEEEDEAPLSVTEQPLCQADDLLDEFCSSAAYCGPGVGPWNEEIINRLVAWWPEVVSWLTDPPPCINRVCFDHDRCYRNRPVPEGCSWTEQSAECDEPFFESYRECTFMFQCGLRCQVIAALARQYQGLNLLLGRCDLADLDQPVVIVDPTMGRRGVDTLRQRGERFTANGRAECVSINQWGSQEFLVQVGPDGTFENLYRPRADAGLGIYEIRCTDLASGLTSAPAYFVLTGEEGAPDEPAPQPPAPPRCGDTQCNGNENRASCSRDCGACIGQRNGTDWGVVDPGDGHLYAVEGRCSHYIHSYPNYEALGVAVDGISASEFDDCYDACPELDGNGAQLRLPVDRAVYTIKRGQLRAWFHQDAFYACSGENNFQRVFEHATEALFENLGGVVEPALCVPGRVQACGEGGQQTCQDDCEWSGCAGDQQECAGSDTQDCGACGEQSRVCNNGQWSPWGACEGEGACTPGERVACGARGQRTCTAQCDWGNCVEEEDGCGGDRNTQRCGACGMQSRVCNNGQWSPWGACEGEGVCVPGEAMACGANGRQTCTDQCNWSDCVGQECIGPPIQDCGACGEQTRVCNNGQWSPWGACEGEGACSPGQVVACGVNGRQTCTAQCGWGACAEQACIGSPTQDCGDCGQRNRVCNNGQWSAWSVCQNEGACSPGEMGACGAGGDRACSAQCQWGDCLNQDCPGASAEACGACGRRTRACNNGQWSAWSVCQDQGACWPGQAEACGVAGERTCSAQCQWDDCVENAPACQAPALVDGGFEVGRLVDFQPEIHRWDEATIEVSPAAARTGFQGLRVEVLAPAQEWEVQAFRSGLRGIVGNRWVVQFWARADARRPMGVQFSRVDGDFMPVGLDERFFVDANWRRFEFEFVATAAANARINFFFGAGGPGSVYFLDDVEVFACDAADIGAPGPLCQPFTLSLAGNGAPGGHIEWWTPEGLLGSTPYVGAGQYPSLRDACAGTIDNTRGVDWAASTASGFLFPRQPLCWLPRGGFGAAHDGRCQ